MRKRISKNIITIYITFTALIIIWELLVYFLKPSPLVIVKPSDIYPVIFSSSSIFLKELIFTFTEVIFGWVIGNLLGIILAISIFSFKTFSKVFVGLGVLVNAVPLIAISAILGGFIGTGQNAKIIIVAILCFFPAFIATLTSFQNVERDYKNLFKTYSASRFQSFLKLTLPHSLPTIATTLKVNIVTAISTAIVSEFFGAYGGIGQFILSRKGFYDLPMVWGAIFYIILAGGILYFGFELLQKSLIKWQK